MKALRKLTSDIGLSLVNIPYPEPGPNEVLIRVDQAAICGTDINIYQWKDWSQKNVTPPVTVGHEFVGTIVDLGSNVPMFKKGMRVSAEGHVVCGTCQNCRTGLMHLCPYTLGIGISKNGSFAELICVPFENVIEIPQNIPNEIASILDPLGNAVHTCLQYPLAGANVLITGAGPIGLMATGIARHLGANKIAISEPNPLRRKMAEDWDASLIFDPNATPIQDVLTQLQLRQGFDVGLEMSGANAALHAMISGLRPGGSIAALGIFPKSIAIDINEVIFKGLQIQGIYGRKMFSTWYQVFSLLDSGLNISPIITHQYSFKDFEEAFSLMGSGKSGKILFDWNQPSVTKDFSENSVKDSSHVLATSK